MRETARIQCEQHPYLDCDVQGQEQQRADQGSCSRNHQPWLGPHQATFRYLFGEVANVEGHADQCGDKKDRQNCPDCQDGLAAHRFKHAAECIGGCALMARPKSKGAYVPLAAQYFMDDAILEAGPGAELLFVRMLSFLASVSSDGFITDRQVRTIVGLGLTKVAQRVDALESVGLIAAVDGGYVVRSWTKWNRSAEEIGRLLARDRDRKTSNGGSSASNESSTEENQRRSANNERRNARNGSENAGVLPVLDPSKLAAKAINSERNEFGIPLDSELQSSTEQSSTEQSTLPTEGVAAKRGSRIPDPFVVTPEMADWARARTPLVNGKLATERFVNFWTAKAGKDATKLDWLRTWQNWLLKDQEQQEQRRGAKPSKDERALSVVEMGARLQAQSEQKAVGQ